MVEFIRLINEYKELTQICVNRALKFLLQGGGERGRIIFKKPLKELFLIRKHIKGKLKHEYVERMPALLLDARRELYEDLERIKKMKNVFGGEKLITDVQLAINEISLALQSAKNLSIILSKSIKAKF